MTCSISPLSGGCGTNERKKLLGTLKGSNYTKEICYKTCLFYNLEYSYCRECAGFSIGVSGNAKGRCALYARDCDLNGTDNNWQYYHLDDCYFGGNLI